MKLNHNNVNSPYNTLQANLYLMSLDFESLKTYLNGYTEEGIYSECLEAVRESLNDFSALIRSGNLSLDTIAKIFDCYYTMESLARYPYPSNNSESFKNSEDWQRVKSLAKAAADALNEINPSAENAEINT